MHSFNFQNFNTIAQEVKQKLLICFRKEIQIKSQQKSKQTKQVNTGNRHGKEFIEDVK